MLAIAAPPGLPGRSFVELASELVAVFPPPQPPEPVATADPAGDVKSAPVATRILPPSFKLV